MAKFGTVGMIFALIGMLAPIAGNFIELGLIWNNLGMHTGLTQDEVTNNAIMPISYYCGFILAIAGVVFGVLGIFHDEKRTSVKACIIFGCFVLLFLVISLSAGLISP